MRANFNLQKSSRNGISDVYAENNPENLMIKVHEMQSIAFMLNNFLVVMPKLCSMLGVQHQNYTGIIYRSLWYPVKSPTV